MSAEQEKGPEGEAPAEKKAAAAKKPAAKAAPKKPAAEKKAPAQKKPAAERKPRAAKKTAEQSEPTAAKEPAGEKPDAGEAVAAQAEPKGRAGKAAAAKAPAKQSTAEKGAAAAKAAEGDAPSAKPARRAAPAAKAAPRRRVVRAHARYVRTSARKARMVCGHLRGRSVQEARAILAFTPREVARDWSKLLESAVANAESNHELLEDDLIVREAYADEGPTIKRFRPRAMGRATPIRKRTSHLTITLIPRPEPGTNKRHG
jgi:ribosomal protein L22